MTQDAGTPPRRGWNPPVAAQPVDAVVQVPGSKSVTNRALVLAALADGESRISRPLRSRDTDLMVAALRGLGAGIAEADDGWLVTPIDAAPAKPDGPVRIDVGNAGTVLRFTPALAALTRRAATFDGDAAVRRRPVAALLAALRDAGAHVAGAAVPFTVVGSGSVRGGRVGVDASRSSQVVSALLLAGPRFDDGLRLTHIGDRTVPNAPHVAMTVTMLRARGVVVDGTAPHAWAVEPGPVHAVDTVVEPDLSSAAPFLAAAVATGGRVRLIGWPTETTQPGGMLPGLLTAFGARVDRDGDDLVVAGGDLVTGAELELRDCGELTPVVAALAALASTPSRLSGIDYLRGHETDRLAALATELGKLGAEVTEWEDGLRIVPKPLRGGVFASYDDHRMVMAAAVVGLVVPGVVVDGAATVGKTYPGFTADWAEMLATRRVGV